MPEEKEASEKKRVRFRDDDDDDGPIVFSSLVDMMEAAGTLPSPSESKSSTTPPRVVEAHLSFSCMTEEEYERRLALSDADDVEKELAYNDEEDDSPLLTFEKQDDDDDDDDHKDDDNESTDDDEDSALNFADLLDDGLEEEVELREPSAFLLLWHVLLELVTPQAAVFLRALHDENRIADDVVGVTPDTDITAARCAGLLAMLKMYLSRALRDLSLPKEEFRNAEHRLSSLLGTFQYARPVAKLEVSHWKAMTCILVQMVMSSTTTTKLPKSVKDIGLSQEEYEYLVQKSIFTLNSRITDDHEDDN